MVIDTPTITSFSFLFDFLVKNSCIKKGPMCIVGYAFHGGIQY
jgi:hypothetical protein